MTTVVRRAITEVRRPLSPMERWYWICDQLSPLNVVARVHVTGACPPAALKRAAALLVDEHPLLRVAVAAEGPTFVGAADPQLPIRTVHFARPEPGRWRHEVDTVELGSSVDWRSGPLARIVDLAHASGTAVEQHDLILTVAHTIADGTTALSLLRRLVALAAVEVGAVEVGKLAPEPVPRAALPPPEAMLPGRLSGVPRALHTAAWTVADLVAATFARPRRLVPQVPVPPERRRTRLLHRQLSSTELGSTELEALVRRCRQERVTVHSALAAALAIAVAAELRGRLLRRRTELRGRLLRRRTEAPPARRVTIGSPVDFRAELVPPVRPDDAGAYVATVPIHLRVGSLWRTARRAMRDLHRRRRLRQQLALVGLLRLMSPRSVGTSARAVTAVDRIGPGNVCLSNVGRFEFPDRLGAWRLSGAQFVAGISVSGYLVGSVNTSHGALHWNFTYIDGAVTGERAARIADRAVRLLLSSLEEGVHSG